MAMVLLVLIISLFYFNLNKLDISINPQVYYRAYLITKREFLKDDILLEYPESYKIDEYLVKKSITKDPDNEIWQVKIEVFLYEGKLIYNQIRIISQRIEF